MILSNKLYSCTAAFSDAEGLLRCLISCTDGSSSYGFGLACFCRMHPHRFVEIGFHTRVLTVAIAYRRRALPLAWSVHHSRKGHVTAEAHIALLRYVARFVPRQSPVWLLGDSGVYSVEEPWYLVSDHPNSLHNIRLYKIRMWIEERYGEMKGHGFDGVSHHFVPRRHPMRNHLQLSHTM